MRSNFRRVLLMALATGVILAAGCFRRPVAVDTRTVSFESGGHRLVADVYTPRRPNQIGVVLLHGSSPSGRRLFLYPELCHALAQRGYTLLNVDQRGYGDSDDPHRPNLIDDYDFVGDAVRAVQFAAQSAPAISTWVLLGHSKGGGVALHAGGQSDAVRAVISISPGRRMDARYFDPEGRRQIAYLQRRKSRDMRLPEPIPVELLEPMLKSYDMGELRGTTWTKPLLLLEGAREPDDDLAYSREWIETLSGPVTHHVLAGADHYFGTGIAETDGVKAWQITRLDVFDALVELVDDWLQSIHLNPTDP